MNNVFTHSFYCFLVEEQCRRTFGEDWKLWAYEATFYHHAFRFD